MSIEKVLEEAQLVCRHGSTRLSLWQGDITVLEIDAIVNAANRSLLGGGGVDCAIHRAAGPELVEFCRTLDGCDTGDAKISPAFELPSKHVIHAVGPMGEKPDLLKSAYVRSLELAHENKLRSVAFPCISTGIYGYPSEEAAPVVLESVKEWLVEHPDALDHVVFCVFLKKDLAIYSESMPEQFEIMEEFVKSDDEFEHSEPEEQ